MAILKAVNVSVGKKRNVYGIIAYVLNDKKTEERLTFGSCVETERAAQMMMETKKDWNKEDGRQYYHFVQSFSPNEKITPDEARQMGQEFLEAARKFQGFEILGATHKDREHIHNHFIINSVSFVDGHKFHITTKELEELKSLQNEICIRHGFSPAPEKNQSIRGGRREETVSNSQRTYRLLQKAESGKADSYVMECALAVLDAAESATDKEEFIAIMKKAGFDVSWNDTKKHVVFTDIKREKNGEKKCKVRLYKLAQYYSEFENIGTKEDLLNVFEANKGRAKNVGSVREELGETESGIDGADVQGNGAVPDIAAANARNAPSATTDSPERRIDSNTATRVIAKKRRDKTSYGRGFGY